MDAFVKDNLVLHVHQIYSVFLQYVPPMTSLHKIPACIWAPWRFGLHEHLPPSHMASIKTHHHHFNPETRLTGSLAVLHSSDPKHTHVTSKSATCLRQHAPWHLSRMHASRPLRNVCFQSSPRTFLYNVSDHWSRWMPRRVLRFSFTQPTVNR